VALDVRQPLLDAVSDSLDVVPVAKAGGIAQCLLTQHDEVMMYPEARREFVNGPEIVVQHRRCCTLQQVDMEAVILGRLAPLMESGRSA